MNIASRKRQAPREGACDIRGALYKELNSGTEPFAGQAAGEIHGSERLKGR